MCKRWECHREVGYSWKLWSQGRSLQGVQLSTEPWMRRRPRETWKKGLLRPLVHCHRGGSQLGYFKRLKINASMTTGSEQGVKGEKCGWSGQRPEHRQPLNDFKQESDALGFVLYEVFTGNCPRGLALVQKGGTERRQTWYCNVEQISSVESY